MDFRQRLLEATTEEDFKRLIIKHSQELAEEQQISNDKRIEMNHEKSDDFEYVSSASDFFPSYYYFSYFSCNFLLVLSSCRIPDVRNNRNRRGNSSGQYHVT